MYADHNIIDRFFNNNDFIGNLCHDEGKNVLRFGYDAEWAEAKYTVYEFDTLDEVHAHLDEYYGENNWR